MQEQEKMKEFAAIEGLRRRESDSLEHMERDLSGARVELTERTLEGLGSQKAQTYLTYFVAQNARIRYQNRLLQQINIEFQRKRGEMGHSINRRKIMTRLEEKHFEQEEYERARLEGSLLDEMAVARHALRPRGGGVSGA